MDLVLGRREGRQVDHRGTEQSQPRDVNRSISLKDSSMAILVRCQCGKKLSASKKYLGRTVACPACGGKLKIEVQSGEVARADLIVFRCECGKKLRARPNAAGRTTKCPQCNAPITVPKPQKTSPTKPKQPVVDNPSSSSIFDDAEILHSSGTDISGLLDEIGAHECKTNRRCPNCKQDMQRDDVVCIQCGYNSRTKKVMGTNTREPRGSAILSSVKHLFTEDE